MLAAVCATGRNAAAAKTLGVAESTVKNHLTLVYAKLGVNGIGPACYALARHEAGLGSRFLRRLPGRAAAD